MERKKGIIKFSRDDRIWFTADSHIGHRNIIKYCQRPFSDVEEMNKTLISNWNKVVGINDYVFHLGDFSQMLFPRQYDVGVDNNNYTPISFEEVEVKIQEQIAKSTRL